MAEDPHALWLFIRPPVVDYRSNKVSSPVLSWALRRRFGDIIRRSRELLWLQAYYFVGIMAVAMFVGIHSHTRVTCSVWIRSGEGRY